MVQRSSYRVYVSTDVGVTGVAAVLFERSILNRTSSLNDGECLGLFSDHELDQTKIDQFNTSGGRELDIGRLNIAMENRRSLSMQVLYGIAELFRPHQNGRLFQETILSMCFLYEVS